ncbi:MAG: CO dehydrogenase/acetyl-CoA synthase complex subunit epsilon [Candidatus Hydrothermarchaeales archaeon]
MIRRPIPWQPTARTGPKQGVAVNARTVKRIIDEAENPIIVAGPRVRHDPELFDVVVALSQKKEIPIIATGGSIKAFKEKGVDAEQMSLLHLVNLLLDPDWRINNKRVDVAVFMGTDYAIANNVFSTLKNWGDVKTVSVSPYYQPNAEVSFENLNDEVFKEYLEVLKE